LASYIGAKRITTATRAQEWRHELSFFSRILSTIAHLEKHGRIIAPVAEAPEQRDTIFARRDCLAIEDARAGHPSNATFDV
jgi:hypothetical protein